MNSNIKTGYEMAMSVWFWTVGNPGPSSLGETLGVGTASRPRPWIGV